MFVKIQKNSNLLLKLVSKFDFSKKKRKRELPPLSPSIRPVGPIGPRGLLLPSSFSLSGLRLFLLGPAQLCQPAPAPPFSLSQPLTSGARLSAGPSPTSGRTSRSHALTLPRRNRLAPTTSAPLSARPAPIRQPRRPHLSFPLCFTRSRARQAQRRV